MKIEYISSRSNGLVRHYKDLLADAGYRRECGEYVCEGDKLYRDAIACGCEVSSVICTEEGLGAVRGNGPAAVVPEPLMRSVTTLKSPQNIIFTVKITNSDIANLEVGRHIVLDGISDPGNVGTIIRTADALSMDSAILCGACADPYGPKAARATMGAIFRLRIYRTSCEGVSLAMDKAGIKLCAASADGELAAGRDSLAGMAVVVGSEGGGVSPELRAMCDHSVRIPISPECESLNAAAAASILMWEMTKRDI